MRKRDPQLAAFVGTNCPQVAMLTETGKSVISPLNAKAGLLMNKTEEGESCFVFEITGQTNEQIIYNNNISLVGGIVFCLRTRSRG